MHWGVLSLPVCQWVWWWWWRCANLNAGAMARNLSSNWRVRKTCHQIWFDLWSKGDIMDCIVYLFWALDWRERGRLAVDNCPIFPQNLDNFEQKRTQSSAGVMIFFKIMTIIAIIVIRLHEGSAESKWPFVWLEQHLGEAGHNHSIAIVRTDSRPFVLLAGLYLMQTLTKGLYLIQTFGSFIFDTNSWQVYFWYKHLQKVHIWLGV